MTSLQTKWDRASRTYDLVTWADERRFAAAKRRLFGKMVGECLMVAAGTGYDFRHFPPGLSVTAIDISPAMLERAQERARAYEGRLVLVRADARKLAFADR